jgi:hypothetical protein
MLNDPVRIFALVAAVAVLVVPYLPALAKQLRAAWSSLPSVPAAKGDGISVSDLTTVLDLANRLRVSGNEKATDLAKQLLDAMLEVPQK